MFFKIRCVNGCGSKDNSSSSPKSKSLQEKGQRSDLGARKQTSAERTQNLCPAQLVTELVTNSIASMPQVFTQ